jgi:hypothetical protein
MSPELIRQAVPFGLAGLAVIAIAIVAINARSNGNRALALVAMSLIAAMVIFDKLYKPPPPAPPLPNTAWFDTGQDGDWSGNDIASSDGLLPKSQIASVVLCGDQAHEGFVALCFRGNSHLGFPPSVPSDVRGTPANWCTYRVAGTGPKPGGKPGRIFRCAIPNL